jgi:molybdopterin-containing oxidoreductase family iron-sulfur binding subunit
MKRLPYPKFESPNGERWWRSLRERDPSPDFEEALARELPEGIAEPPEGLARRDFFRVMGASMALAGVAACRRPNEKILPYSRQPEELIPGVPLYFATAMPWNGTAIGLLVESHEGRPTKIEGNPRHPESLGATNSWAQASVLELYDPDRSTAPSQGGTERTWDDASAALRAVGVKHKAAGGRGLAVLTEAHRSPTVARLLADLKKDMPGAQVFRYDAFARDNARQGARLALGAPLEQVLQLDKARVVVALDADLFMHDGGSDVRHHKQWAAARRAGAMPGGGGQGKGLRLYAVESSHTVTGAVADHRLRMTSKQVSAFAVALAAQLGAAAGLEAPPLDDRARTLLNAVARDLGDNRGQSLVVAGEKQPPVVHALAAGINRALANVDQTVRYVPPFDEAAEGPASLASLAQAIRDQQITSLVILGGNPVFNGPGDLGLGDLVAGLENSFHLSLYRDETSARTQWHLNRAHYLESWGDVRALDGTTSIIQPLIAPLFDGQTDAEVLSMLLGAPRRAYELVRASHGGGAEAADGFEQSWRRALHDGLLPQTAYEPAPAGGGEAQAPSLAEAARQALAPAPGIEITFVPDMHAWDGRFANSGWMQELPDPMTKLTWGNAAWISPATARQLGVEDGDLLSLTAADGATVTIPALILVGQADGSLTLHVGQGRSAAGRVGDGVGVDVSPLRTTRAFHTGAVSVAKAGGREKLARTQEHYSMSDGREQRAVVREATVAEYAQDPKFVEKYEVPGPELQSLYPDVDYSKVQRWALAIDLGTCTGCSACVTACVAENNIPVVGKKGVLMSREMQWIRVDRYFKGTADDPQSVTQPMTCQQCENAPCEQVCPVAATQHSPEGLNDMAYNRCIGTKYCLNNCPFKVRRFNYFNYASGITQIRRAQFNPDVTIRSRGVMEKCTYCVQRINAAKIDAHRQGKDRVADGGIKTACQQVCPADAIVFGDLNDPRSQVAKMKDEPRSYVLLRELNVRPRTTYLAKIRNPNTEIA